MSTLSSSYSHQASGEQVAADNLSAMSLATLVQQQLAVLEALAVEGQNEATALQAEVTDLSARLSAVVARFAKLETTLSNHARILGAIRAGLQEATSRAATSRTVPARQNNGLQETHESPRPTEGEQSTGSAAAEPSVVPPLATAVQPTTPVPPREPVPAHQPSPEPVPSRESATAPVAAEPSSPAAPAASSVPARPATTSPQPVPQPAPAPQPVPATPPPVVDDGRPRVQRGSTVEVAFEDDSTEIYTLVRPDQASPGKNLIGDNTPLGVALMGACVGDERTYRVRANAPEQSVRVRSIA